LKVKFSSEKKKYKANEINQGVNFRDKEHMERSDLWYAARMA